MSDIRDPQHIISDGMPTQLPDIDPGETGEWVDSLEAIVQHHGPERARYIMLRLLERSRELGVGVPALRSTDYINTIPPSLEPYFPGDREIEDRIQRYVRWNAAVMVTRAQRPGVKVGGHIATYASSSTLYEVGFNHFFQGRDHPGGGDHVFIQGHGSPGVYSRAFLEGRLSEQDLDLFRQESYANGLSSYPHPRLMPHFWEFPTVSMGLGPINSIYQARFDRYLQNRGISDTSQRHVWAFVGDGEMDEPEAQGALTVAAREELDNLTWVVNCNLQRLDGPVRGNGKIIQELESLFRGAGWNVIKVVWGSKWDELLSLDIRGELVDQMNRTPDGQFQTYTTKGSQYIKDNFFNTPELRRILDESSLTDEDLPVLDRGGHDLDKVYAAYAAAAAHKGQPTVILAKTIKGWTLGPDFESRNATHQMKELTKKALIGFRDRLGLDISDEQLSGDLPPYAHPGEDSEEVKYIKEHRARLGGAVPQRTYSFPELPLPPHDVYGELKKGSGGAEVATTMAFVRLLKDLFKQPGIGPRIVPIIPDEARTFGMDSLFPTEKIYSPHGQTYEPVDQAMLLSYKEATNGRILHEGITEAGSLASFTAAASSYASNEEPMLPIYLFYSMFGFQRTADAIWAAADQRCRGFLIGATAGRTTLNGEGLQHEDGHSHLIAATNPAIRSWDPSFAYELAVITEDGVNTMMGPDAKDVMYYITMYNEPVVQPPMPEHVTDQDVLDGIYKYASFNEERQHRAHLLTSGSAMPETLRAMELLGTEFDVAADVWSVPGWVELHRNGIDCETWNRDHPMDEAVLPTVTRKLAEAVNTAIVAVSDYQMALPMLIAPFVPGDMGILGTDGFGRSDTRAALRRIFRIDAESIVVSVLSELAQRGEVSPSTVEEAISRFAIDPNYHVWNEA